MKTSSVLRISAFLFALLGNVGLSHALDLLEAWRAAQSQDPQVAVSQAAAKAGAARREQSNALWRPSVQLIVGGSVGLSESGSTGAHFAAPGQPASNGVDFNTSVQAGLSGRWVLSARKALSSGERSAQGRQLELSADMANLQFQADHNALMLQTATRYLDVVLAHKSLALLGHQHQAAQSALVQAQDRFVLGDKPITDTHEARQRAMQLQAQVLAAKSTLTLAQRVLAKSTGLPETQMHANDLQPLAALVHPSAAPQVSTLEALHAQAQARNIGLRLHVLRVEIAAQEIVKSSATSRSSLDLVAKLGQDRISGDGAYGNASNSATQGLIGVQWTMPLSSGGMRDARLQEALHLRDLAQAELEAAEQSTSQSLLAAWLQQQNGPANLAALQAAYDASVARLDATRLGLEVGDRNTLELLQAINEAGSSALILEQARHALLIGQLQLQALTGPLVPQDLSLAARQWLR
jgi:outer membrane protein